MPGVTLGFLKYVLGLDTLSFRKGISQADADLARMQKNFAAKGKEFTKLGKSMTTFVTLPLAALGVKSYEAAKESQEAIGQVNAALKSMGPVAGRSAEQLEKQAKALQHISTFDDDEILRKVTANMLTFGNVSGTAFDRAQVAAVNLSVRLGQDLQASTIQIGKALNDPIKGLTSLRRVGIAFTQQQQDQIKAMVAAGNTAGAQAIILKELEREFGGAAEAQRKATPTAALNEKWRDFTETVGAFAIKVLPPLTGMLTALLAGFNALPAPVQALTVGLVATAAIAGPLLIGFGSLLKLIALAGPAVTVLATAWKLLQAGLIAARIAALATLPALLPYLIPLAAIALAAGAVYLAWKNWDKIKAIVASVYTAVKTAFVDKLEAVWAYIEKKVGKVVELFRWMWDKLVGHSYVPDTVDAIEQHFGRLGDVMVAPAEKATKATAAAFAALKDKVGALLDQLFPEDAQFRQQLDDVKTLDAAYKAHLITLDKLIQAKARIAGQADPFAVDLGDTGTGLVGNIPDLSTLVDQMPQLVDQTKQWGDALGQIGSDLFARIGDDLSSIVSGTMKLKDLWKDLLAFGIRELTSSSGPLGSLISGKRATGGPVTGGSAYLVGERGPEIFVPSAGGRIVSNDNSRRMLGGAGGGGAGWTGDMIVYANDADSFGRSETQIARRMRRRMGR